MVIRGVLLAGIGTFMLGGCTTAPQAYEVDYYHSAYRQLPPEPVYSRVTWTHLPQPIRTKVRDEAPLFMPTISFELPRSSLEEAIEALAQTIGYTWQYPKQVGKRKIAIKMIGTVQEVLDEINRQASVHAVLDHDQRIVRVMDEATAPSLPDSALGSAQ